MSIPHNQSITQNQKNANTLLAAALEYAQRGWPVLPLKPRGKRPLTHHGVKDATTDEKTIRHWWQRWPNANIGIATGKASGIIVLDIDGPDGEEFVTARTPPTPTVRTGKGRHLYFKHPGGTVRNFARKVPGLDIRGDGGYVVAPPSIHPDGATYTWEISPADAPLADTPEWLAALIRQKERVGRRETGEYWLSRALEKATPGTRNETGFWLACQLRDSGLSMDEAEPYMRRYVGAAPAGDHDYTVQEALASLRSAYSAPPREAAHGLAAGLGATIQIGKPLRWLDNTEQKIAELPCTDAGNAEAFALLWGDYVRFDHRRKRWLIWSPPRWRVDTNGEVYRWALETARERLAVAAAIDDAEKRRESAKWALQSESAYRQKAMLEMAKVMLPIADAGDGWDTDDYLIGCENGLVDLRTGELRDGQPGDRITMTTRLNYNPDATAPRWKAFLQEVFGDPELIDFIQRAVGYSLTGDTSEQVLFLCYGVGANGKTVFLNTLRYILGDYAINISFETLEAASFRDGSAPSPDVARLEGRRLVTASETKEGVRLNEGRVKSLTGGDPITARHLHAEPFTFTPRCKIWLAVNHKPRVSDDSYGFWRRIRLIPFTRVFGPNEADPHLLDTLQNEAEGILAWAVRGCLEWQRRGLQPPAVVVTATEEYRAEEDPLSQFIAERCVVTSEARAKATDLYNAYKEWCQGAGLTPMSATAFGRRMTSRYPKEKSRDGIFYAGIGLL